MADEKVFVDTNVFAYALDISDEGKRSRAAELIEARRRSIVVSTQVLLELASVCTRKLGMTRARRERRSPRSRCFPQPVLMISGR